jgi:hypothetical protein
MTAVEASYVADEACSLLRDNGIAVSGSLSA